jgi:hypothetical protein
VKKDEKFCMKKKHTQKQAQKETWKLVSIDQ